MSLNPKVSETTTGLVIAVLLFALTLSAIAVFYQAQVIAKQQSVIQMMEVHQ